MADKVWMSQRRSVLDQAEYFRSIGKTDLQAKLETHVKAMDYGVDGFGKPYKKLNKSQLANLMAAEPVPNKLPKASKSDKTDAIDVAAIPSGKPRKSMDGLLKEAQQKGGALVTQKPSTPVVKGGAIVPSPGGALTKDGGGIPPGKSKKDILKQQLRIGAKRGLRGAKRIGKAIGEWDGTFTDRLTMASKPKGMEPGDVAIERKKGQKALPASVSPMQDTSWDKDPDEDWEGDPMDHRDIPWAKRGIDDLRDQIDKDPNIPFPKDKTPWYDDITGLMKKRDESIEQDEQEKKAKADVIEPEVLDEGSTEGDKALPIADGKKRRKTRGKTGVGFGSKAKPKKGSGSPLTGGMKSVLENIIKTRKAIFDLYKISKDRFKLRKKVDKQMDTSIGAKTRERNIEGPPDSDQKALPGSKGTDDNLKEDKDNNESWLEKMLMDTMGTWLAMFLTPLFIDSMHNMLNDQADEIEDQEKELDKQDPTKGEEKELADAEKQAADIQAEVDTAGEPKLAPDKPEDEKTVGEGGKIDTNKFLSTPTPRETSNFGGMEPNDGGQQEVPQFKEGGVIKPSPSVNSKSGGGNLGKQPKIPSKSVSKPGPTSKSTNTKTGLSQLGKTDIGGIGKKVLEKVVSPAKSIFKLPNLVAKKALKIGKRISKPLGKLMKSDTMKKLAMSPLNPFAGAIKGIRGMMGKDGKDGEDLSRGEQLKQDFQTKKQELKDRVASGGGDKVVNVGGTTMNLQQVKEDYPNIHAAITQSGQISEGSTSTTMTTGTTTFGAVKDTISKGREKLKGIRSALGSGLKRGLLGIADHYTGNRFDFDGMNVKPDEVKDASIEKGQSVTDKMMQAMESINTKSVSTAQKNQQSTDNNKMSLNSQKSSTMSPAARNSSLQPRL